MAGKCFPRLELAREWFDKARADIDFAQIGFKETRHYGQVCFLSQQAVEKYLKGFLVACALKPKKIHTTATLMKQCGKLDIRFKSFIDQCKILDRYYIPSRYPVSPGLAYSKEEAQRAMQTMEEVVGLVEQILQL